ncbi:aldo/keto reductase [Agromyces mangrovi Wang et al. 2018]|uniref:aldo/keto reductase n=1 Tax=Agromyces mangrovi TaxID=1858653 RepID=UPI00257395D0|nr:aldo/keto reductase [Agromyces mangrovi]BDZ64746.1 2,5-diketo-D-gluconic acid reductase [Agromyces mangrovi]
MHHTISLNDGTELPQIGLGVYLVTDVDICEASVTQAIDSGYRLIDTATVYRNERAVGRGIRASGVPRDQIVVTTKIWPSDYGARRTRAAIERSLDRLGTGRIDLLLLHQPVGDVAGAWAAMEDAVDRGDVGSIGVSNFTAEDLRPLLASARVRPAVDQVELHPYWRQPDLLPFLAAEGIVPQAWYPLGHGSTELLAEPAVTRPAERTGRSPVQVVLRWHVQSGIIALPKSTNPAHIAANLDIFDFELEPAEMAAIDALGRSRPMYRAPRWALSALARLGTPPQLR